MEPSRNIHDPGAAPLEYSQITDWLFIGTNQCCQMHFEEELLAKGITVDISLEQERIDMPSGVETFLWLPTVDLAAPTMAAISTGIAVLREAERLGQKVYVHCKNGHGRGPTLVAAFLIVAKGMDIPEAILTMKEERPSIHLEPPQLARLEEIYSQFVPR